MLSQPSAFAGKGSYCMGENREKFINRISVIHIKNYAMPIINIIMLRIYVFQCIVVRLNQQFAQGPKVAEVIDIPVRDNISNYIQNT